MLRADDSSSPCYHAELWPPKFEVDSVSIAEHQSRKMVHIIRHAEGFHNVNHQYRDISNFDARLTPKGVAQCQRLSRELRTADWIQEAACNGDLLIVTSPLTRCIETTLGVFEHIIPGTTARVLAVDSIRETVNFNCDRRRTVTELSKEFPQIDFSLVDTDEDAIWKHYEERLGDYEKYTSHRESTELHKVADRGRDFFQWLEKQPESTVVICTHSAFLRCILNFGYGVPNSPEQLLDKRDAKLDEPVFVYKGEVGGFEDKMRSDYDNCELRTMSIVFSG